MKVALVTGGATGIGRAICERLAKAGHCVVIHYNNSCDEAALLAYELDAQGSTALTVRADLRKVQEIDAMFERVQEKVGYIDTLVNNAAECEPAALQDTTAEAIDSALALNVRAVLLGTRAAVPLMRKRGGGAIINISSYVGKSAAPGAVVYSATKAAVDALTVGLAQELGPQGVRVNAIAPGTIRTRIYDRHTAQHESLVVARTALRRIGEPSEIADTVEFLASEASSFITGQVIQVCGGIRT